MRAIAIEQFGEEPRPMGLPRPEPGPGEVLVKLEAASVNPMDWQVAAGAFQGRMPHTLPLILGLDGAGRIEAVGRGVRGLAAGDAVFGQLWPSPIGKGTFVEYVPISEEIANGAVERIPEGVSMAAAAALPTAGITALGAVEAIGCGGARRC